MAQDETRDYRFLRGRLIELQQMAYRNRQMLQDVDWGKNSGRDNSADLQRLHLENDTIEGEMLDIEDVLYKVRKMTISPATVILAAAIVLGVFMALLVIGALASGAFHA